MEKQKLFFGLAAVLLVMSCPPDNKLIDRSARFEMDMTEREHHACIKPFTATNVEFAPFETKALYEVSIGTTGISEPIGKFILVRRNGQACAIRFTKMYHGNDGHPPSIFSSGEESLYTDYEWYRPKGGGEDFSDPNLESGSGTASEKAPIGIGRFAFGWGNRSVKCGSFRLGWNYPNVLSFLYMTYPRKEYELAPTKWQSVREINIKYPSLKWYQYDDKRKNVNLPIDQLWRGQR